MISDLDESIRQFLIKEGNFSPSAIDISFEIPNREWSASISRPTINCYLFDLHENLKLRQGGSQVVARGGQISQRRPPFYYDLTYLVTAWTRVVEDEHRLLWHALQTLARFAELPSEHLQGDLQASPEAIATKVAQPDGVLKSPGEFWTALGNELKPSLNYLVTVPLQRDTIVTGPPVLTTSLRVSPIGPADAPPVVEEGLWIAGTVRDAAGAPMPDVQVSIEGRSQTSRTDAAGHFRLRGNAPGHYTLIAQSEGRQQRQEIDVRSTSYDISFGGG